MGPGCSLFKGHRGQPFGCLPGETPSVFPYADIRFGQFHPSHSGSVRSSMRARSGRQAVQPTWADALWRYSGEFLNWFWGRV